MLAFLFLIYLPKFTLSSVLFAPVFNDAPASWQFGFQNPATPVMEGIIALYNYIFVFLVLVFVVVVWFFVRSLFLFNKSRNPVAFEFTHDPVIETVWTIVPAFILIFISAPSFSLLYAMDDAFAPMFTVKVIGHQWYWSYEYNLSRVDYLLDYLIDEPPRRKIYWFTHSSKFSKFKLKTQAKLNKLFDKYLKLVRSSDFYTPKAKMAFQSKFIKASGRPCIPIRSLTFKMLKNSIRFVPKQYLYDFDRLVFNHMSYVRNHPLNVKAHEYARFHQGLFATYPTLIHKPPRSNFWMAFAHISKDQIARKSIALVSPNLKFDSYMVPEADLKTGALRLLEVDNRLVLPVNCNIRLIITSADVIHSWAVPSLGIKVDAIPGRLNQVSVFLKRTGVFYGQCSELCGVNHAYMPIVVQAVDTVQFNKWFRGKLHPTLKDLLSSWTIEAR